jgi:hypothetical protein
LSDRYCYLPLAAGSSNGLTNTFVGMNPRHLVRDLSLF